MNSHPIVITRTRSLIGSGSGMRTPTSLATQAASKVLPALSVSEPTTVQAKRIVYCGRHRDGRFRLTINGHKFLIRGAIYALSQSSDHKGNPLWLKLLLDMTPGYRVQKTDELSFDAVCNKTGARMAVMGQVTPLGMPSQREGVQHG